MGIEALAAAIQDTDPGTLFGYISLLIGSITGVAIAIINTRKKKETPIAAKALQEATKELKEIKARLEHERKARSETENKWDSLKISFRILYQEYEQQWKDDPDKIGMLKTMKDLFDL